LVAGLVIIWAAFLLPFGSRRASPAATVEEFERKMGILAETNRQQAGRWVLVPRKGERFMGPRDRERVRVRRRRKHVFTVLLETTGLTLLIGLFPPLRDMLFVTAVLVGVLVLYVGLLVRLRLDEHRRARLLRVRRARAAAERFERVPVGALRRTVAYANGNGHSNGNGRAHSNGNGHGHTNGNGNGHHESYPESGLRIVEEDLEVLMDDDVHVVIRRPAQAT